MRVIHLEISDDDNRFRALASEDIDTLVLLLSKYAAGNQAFVDAMKLAIVKTETHSFVAHIASLFGVDAQLLTARSKGTLDISHVRQIGMWYLKRKCKLSGRQAGLLFNRDGSTVQHALRTIDGELEFSESTREKVMLLEKSFATCM